MAPYLERQVDGTPGLCGDPFQQRVVGSVGDHDGGVWRSPRVKPDGAQERGLVDSIARRPNHLPHKERRDGTHDIGIGRSAARAKPVGLHLAPGAGFRGQEWGFHTPTPPWDISGQMKGDGQCYPATSVRILRTAAS